MTEQPEADFFSLQRSIWSKRSSRSADSQNQLNFLPAGTFILGNSTGRILKMFISQKLLLKTRSLAWRPRKKVASLIVITPAPRLDPKRQPLRDSYVHYK